MSINSVLLNNKSILKSKIDDLEIHHSKLSDGAYHAIHNNISYEATVTEVDIDRKIVRLLINGKRFECNIESHLDHTIKELNLNSNKKVASKDLISSMPGLVLSILVEEGEGITEGQPLMILEAMKMENVLKANSDGVVQKITCSQGEAVEKRQLLIEIA